MSRWEILGEEPEMQEGVPATKSQGRWEILEEVPEHESSYAAPKQLPLKQRLSEEVLSVLRNLPGQAYSGLVGAETAAGDLMHGLIQPITESGYLGERIKKASQDVGAERRQKFKTSEEMHPVATNVGALLNPINVGTALIGGPAVAGPKALTGAQKALSIAKKIGKGSALGALYGAADYEHPGESRLWNAGVGATIGAAIPAAIMTGKGTIGLGSKLLNKVKSYKDKVYKPEIRDLMNTAEEYGVDILPGDISTDGALPKVSEMAEKLPGINILGARKKQMQQAEEAARKFVGNQKEKMVTQEFGGPDGLKRLQEVASGNSKRAPRARQLLQDIENSGEDWNRIIQTSGNVSLLHRKLKADELSDKVTKIAEQFGEVPEIRTKSAIESALKELEEQRVPNKGVLSFIRQIQKNMTNTQTYDQMRGFASDLGKKISDFMKGENALIGEKGIEYLRKIKDAVDLDMESFANSHSAELKEAYKAFKNYYKNNVVPFKDKMLAKSLKSADPDEVFSQFIKQSQFGEGKGHGKAARFYEALDKKGREAVKFGVVNRALDKAFNEQNGAFSAAKFASELKRNQPAIQNFYSELERGELEKFAKLMRRIERSGFKTPETGVKAIPWIYGLSTLATTAANPALGTGLITGQITLKKLMQSPKVARFLAASSEPHKGLNMNLEGAKESVRSSLRNKGPRFLDFGPSEDIGE